MDCFLTMDWSYQYARLGERCGRVYEVMATMMAALWRLERRYGVNSTVSNVVLDSSGILEIYWYVLCPEITQAVIKHL